MGRVFHRTGHEAEEHHEITLVEATLRLAEAIAAQRSWMNAAEAAEFLRYDRSTFNSLAAAGRIPRHKKEGAGWRYNTTELTQWMISDSHF